MTPDEIIAHRRRRLLALADDLANVSEACRQMGISRTRCYAWKRLADHYGFDALTPKTRRKPQLENATPTHVVNELLSLCVLEPTLGCRQLADRLGDRGFQIGKTTVQNLLNTHPAASASGAAAIAAQTTGLVTDAAREDDLFGFCHFAAAPGDLVAMDSFYIGHLTGVGKVYQLTAIDTATRWAIVMILVGPVTAEHSIAFVDYVTKRMRRLGESIRGVLTDNGPEWDAKGFQAHLAAKGFHHRRIPPPLAEPQRGLRALPRHDPPRVLAPGHPPAALHEHPPAPGRSRRLPRHLHDFMAGRTPRQVLDRHLANREPQGPPVTSSSGAVGKLSARSSPATGCSAWRRSSLELRHVDVPSVGTALENAA